MRGRKHFGFGFPFILLGIMAVALVVTFGVPASESATASSKEVRIGFSEPFLNSPYRAAMVRDAKAWLQKNHPEWKLIITDGQRSMPKQINDVEDLIAQKVDVIMMAPGQEQPLVPVAKKIMDAKIPLIVVDRELRSDDYTAFVGGDNVQAGRVVAEYIAKRLNYGGNVVQIQGELGASATIDRDKGFKEVMKKYSNIKIIVDQSADYKRDKAMSLMEDILQANRKIDAVYAQSDEMAFGSLKSIQSAKRQDEMFVCGTDGEKDAFDAIKKGEFACTVLYPTATPEALQLVERLLKGEKIPRRTTPDTPLITKENVDKHYDSGI